MDEKPVGFDQLSMILIAEDVWGPAFKKLALIHQVSREPQLWMSPDQLKTRIAEASVLVVRNRTQVTADLMKSAPKLKVIARAGVGLDNIDLETANELGIVVVVGLGANSTSVGELTVGLALSLLRNIPTSNSETKLGNWNRTIGRELSGLTWAILGCGATGQATARLLREFNLKFLGFDPFVDPHDPRMSDLKISMVSLDEALSNADVVSVHMPATPATINLLNSTNLSHIKHGALIINVGRGEVINESALIAALKSGQISGAALDVRAIEPPIKGELEDLSNVILTPHIAGITEESQRNINEILVSNICLVLAGKIATHAVGKVKESSRK